MGTMWLHWSIHPSPQALSLGQPCAGWRAREIFLWLHQGVPGSRLSRGYWELVHHWGFPSCSQCPAFSSPFSPSFSHWVLGFSTGSCPGPNLEELLSLHVHSCVLSTHLQCCAQGSWCFEPRGDLGVPLFSSCIISLWSCW